MPRAWPITHRCHQRDFLLKFSRDRRRWRQGLFEATKRFRLCVLDYVIMSNHIHLLVRDQGRGEIADEPRQEPFSQVSLRGLPRVPASK